MFLAVGETLAILLMPERPRTFFHIQMPIDNLGAQNIVDRRSYSTVATSECFLELFDFRNIKGIILRDKVKLFYRFIKFQLLTFRIH